MMWLILDVFMEASVIDIGLLLAGIILVFFGAVLSVYTISLLGFLIGSAGGYFLAPELIALGITPTGALALPVVVLIVGAIGAIIAYSALTFAVAGAGFLVGAFLGRFLVTPLLDGGLLFAVAAVIVGGVGGAWIGMVFTKTGLIVISSFIGAALASRSITIDTLELVREGWTIEPIIFDPLAPIFLVIFIFGIISQFGLFRFGYVRKLWRIFPGLRRGPES